MFEDAVVQQLVAEIVRGTYAAVALTCLGIAVVFLRR